MWGWKYLSWIRPFESSRAFLTLRLYKTPNAGVSTLKRPCAGVLTNLKSGREPFALAWHTPRGPIFEYFLLLICFKVFFEHISFGFKNLLVTIWSPRAGTRQEKLHLLPGRHFVQPGKFDITCVKKTRAKLLFYLQSLAKELTESDLTNHEYFSGFEMSGAAGGKFRSDITSKFD